MIELRFLNGDDTRYTELDRVPCVDELIVIKGKAWSVTQVIWEMKEEVQGRLLHAWTSVALVLEER